MIDTAHYGRSAPWPPKHSVVREQRTATKQQTMAKSSLQKRSIVVRDRKTSVSLEDEFWKAIKEIAKAEKTTPHELLDKIAGRRHRAVNLSSAIRLFILDYYRRTAGP